MQRLAATASPPPWRWLHGVLIYAVVQALTFGLYRLVGGLRGARASGGEGQIRDFYYEGYRPVFAPPAWLFGPVWTVNNACCIWGLLRALNKPASTARDRFLLLQAASWLDYILFAAAYFALRSPINGLVLTALYLAFTVAGGVVALFGLRDSKLALSLATLFVWLLLATSLSALIALWNRDELYGVGPFAAPLAGWAKTGPDGGMGERQD